MNRLTRLATRLNSPESTQHLLSFAAAGQIAAVATAPLGRRLTTTTSTTGASTSTHSDLDQYSNQRRRKVLGLPKELSGDVLALTCESSAAAGVCHVYVVGTEHYSMESCRQVKAVISYVQPEILFLELCGRRKGALTHRIWKVPTVKEMAEIWRRGGNLFQILHGWGYAMIATRNGFYLGSEFRVAYVEAWKYSMRKVILGDRPVEITLERTFRLMPLLHKIKLFFFPLFFLPSLKDIKEMLKQGDGYDRKKFMMQKMRKEFPTIFQTFVNERDQFMSCGLLRVASKQSSVVAVVGKGHLPGIEKYWNQHVVVKDLLEIPPKKPPVSGAAILKAMFGRWFRK